MATLVLSAAGMALGGSLGGSVLGLSMAAVGRAAGAMVGRSIDQQILGRGSEPVEHGRIDRFRLTGANEGQPLQRIYGRMRVAGHVIWASDFREHVSETGGGKGAAPRPKTRGYSYSVSMAVALCMGQITRVGRVWADGIELRQDQFTMHVYDGSSDQAPDPTMEAIEGIGNVPSYPGLAYVVFTDLDVTQFGNRVPQLSFEVHRPTPAQDRPNEDLARMVRGVAMIPGTGEYSLSTSPVALQFGFAEERVVNVNSGSGETDFVHSARALDEELPECNSVSLVVSWFGNDLRCGECRIRPMVEQADHDADTMPWQVAGINRSQAEIVPRKDGASVYGGTPCDESVKQAIQHLNAQGKRVMFYPFILMDQLEDNGLPDPWSDAPNQAVLPWRGRITTSKAPKQDGSPDQTAAARTEVDHFFEHAQGMRRMILHYAQLCTDAGGVHAFCIGSEMRALTFARDDQGYPAVDQFIRLAADVRAILGPNTKITYASDWSEYHGHQPGNGDKIFHLDPLWADENIDFIGIDNYMPLSDWRDGDDHLDAAWGDIYNLDYLRANIAGGEMFDWYYESSEARDSQIRTPITDGLSEPWVWRQKDLKGWWMNYHYNRFNGVKEINPTAWEPGSKPIWFTEYGCAAIEKGTNQPNKFLDPKSSESQLPHYSNGQRDDYMQMQYMRAVNMHFADPDANPVHPETGERMVDMNNAHAWAWDARPWPAFPARSDLWTDGGNYLRGHWLNGRSSNRTLANVVREICARAGLGHINTTELHGLVRGYMHADTQTARQSLQPLMLAHGFDAIEREGELIFKSRREHVDHVLSNGDFALDEQGSGAPEITRSAETDVAGRAQLAYVESDGTYESRASEAVLSGSDSRIVAGQELPVSLTLGEADQITKRWLLEARASRDSIRFALPPSRADVRAGDVVEIHGRKWRVDRAEDAGRRLYEASAITGATYRQSHDDVVPGGRGNVQETSPVEALFLDLPLMQGSELPSAPHVAMTARPWPGATSLLSAPSDGDYQPLEDFSAPAWVGVTETDLAAAPAGIWDRGPALRVKMVQGDLQSLDPAALLNGGNLAAIGDGNPENWELFQFAEARMVEPRVYELNLRLRGQGGSNGIMPAVWPVGSKLVILNSATRQIFLPASQRGVSQHYRWGPANRPTSDATWKHGELAFQGIGLRPYSVCHLRAERKLDADRFSWIRRTRIEGDSWNGFEVPLGEERELYNVQVIVNNTVVQEIQHDAPNWELSHTARDALGAGAGYSLAVAQISDRFGPGPVQMITVN